MRAVLNGSSVVNGWRQANVDLPPPGTPVTAPADPSHLLAGQCAQFKSRDPVMHTYWVSPRDISTTTIDRLWAPDTDATVLTVQLRCSATGATTVGVAVRYHTGGPLAGPPLTGLNPWTGRHDLGLTAGLVMADGAPRVPAREVAPGERLRVAIGATGIIIGTTASGHPLLVDLGDPTGMATVTVAGELALTVQLALRAAATGYQVLVCTERAQRWRHAAGAGLQVVGAAGLAEELVPARRRWMVVYDHVAGPAPQGAAITVRTVAPGSASGADIHIEQDDRGGAAIRTWAFQYRVRIDADYERRLITAGPRRAA
jgi:hypothetical protein